MCLIRCQRLKRWGIGLFGFKQKNTIAIPLTQIKKMAVLLSIR